MVGKNTGISYETLTRGFFQAILNQGAVQNITVQHDVTIPGISGANHQIDVYWEFDVGGVRYRTVVQCKDWNARVKQEQVFAFHAVLADIPGQPRGIMVSKRGFQEGARRFAKSHSIALYQLREADDDYWAGRIKTIEITGHLVNPIVSNVKLSPDVSWVKARKKELGLDTLKIEVASTAAEMLLVDEHGAPAGTIAQAILQGLPRDGLAHAVSHRQVVFEKPTFLLVPHNPAGKVKLLGLEFDGGLSVIEQKIVVDGADAIRFILTSYDTLDVYTADGALRVTRRGPPVAES